MLSSSMQIDQNSTWQIYHFINAVYSSDSFNTLQMVCYYRKGQKLKYKAVFLPFLSRTGQIICWAQCKLKMLTPCSKSIKNSKMVTVEWGLSECGQKPHPCKAVKITIISVRKCFLDYWAPLQVWGKKLLANTFHSLFLNM